MKVIVKENLGAEYASDLISSCNQSGIQAIADYTGNEILFYDPKNWLYGRHSDMMKDASLEDDIFSIFNGKTPELRAKVLKPAKGGDFREFAVEWNNLQKQESPDIIKTKNCSMIRFGAHESGMSRSSMKGEYPAKIEWQVDFPKVGINAGDTEKLVLRFSEIDALAHAHGGNGFEELIEEMMNEKYPGIGQLDYEDDYIITNFEDMCDYHDMYIGKERVYESLDDERRDWSSNEEEVEVQWVIDDEELGIVSGSTESFVIDLDLVDCFEELVYQVTKAMEGEYGGMTFDYDDEWIFTDEDKWLKRFGYNMNEDSRDIEKGNTMKVEVEFVHGHYGKKTEKGQRETVDINLADVPDCYDIADLKDYIAPILSEQVPGRGMFTRYDFDIVNEDEVVDAVTNGAGWGDYPEMDFDNFDMESIPDELTIKEGMKYYETLYDAYYDHKMDSKAFRPARDKVLKSIVNGLLKEKTIEELGEEWFKDYGTMNGWGWKTSFKYSIACELHQIHKKKHPDEHVPDRVDTVRGWHEDNCSCGLCSSCDSSD